MRRPPPLPRLIRSKESVRPPANEVGMSIVRLSLLSVPTCLPLERLTAGSERPWPQDTLDLLSGEVLLLAEVPGCDGQPLMRSAIEVFRAPCRIPCQPLGSPSFRLLIKATAAAYLRPTTERDLPMPVALDSEAIEARLRLDLAATAKRQHGTDRLDQALEQHLLTSFDQACHSDEPVRYELAMAAPADPLLQAVALLSERHCTRCRPPRQRPATAEADLRLLLDRSGLLWREVNIDSAPLNRDCGDLVGFRAGSANEPVVLLSEKSGYRLWEPSKRARPERLGTRHLQQAPLPARMLAIQPALPANELHSRRLLRFTYGTASHPTRWVLAGAALGLLIGFTLAVGQEAGVAQWIFGVGAVGLLLGVSLALLSNGFRLAVIAVLLSTLLGLLTPSVNTILTNQALPERDLALMLQLGGILLAAALADVLLQWAQSHSLLAVQLRGAMRLQFAGLDHLLKLPAGFFQRFGAGDLALRYAAISQLNEELQTLLSGGLLKALLSAIYLLFMLRISLPLTGVAVVMALLLLLPTALLGWQSRRYERSREQAAANAASRNLELISSVAKLRVAGAEARAARHWAESYSPSVAYAFALDAKAAIAHLLQTVVPNLGQLLLYLAITHVVAEAARTPGSVEPDLGELLGFFSAFGVFIGSMASLADLAVGAFDLPVLYERARPILETPQEVSQEAIDPGPLEGALALDDVWFCYGSDRDAVLRGVTLHANPGECIALVGPSGSGKSTIVRLLLGLDQPEQGTVRYDGHPLADLRIDVVRQQIGCVVQQPRLFAGSIFDAIAGGAQISLDQAWEAASQAALADDIRAMPMQMHTVLPEGGGTLSGGQRQRLAIARALVRQPCLLIFDEATSALDNRTQMAVAESLAGLCITRLLIAHRLSTIRQADRIYVLEDGRISQQGRFDDLIQQPGCFAELMTRQEA